LADSAQQYKEKLPKAKELTDCGTLFEDHGLFDVILPQN
jgi:hypothetical protein